MATHDVRPQRRDVSDLEVDGGGAVVLLLALGVARQVVADTGWRAAELA
ncbi:hypothetical protein NOCARDAX2BIS_720008 [Nocardioides sp. AX2bis]|nr:hypothetical protein NOCARDAX2BIS_720008 [Nocardioides sp. AX2bis]